MGKHRDPDTLAFIEWLKNKGESFGFLTATEYPMRGRECILDVAWKLKEEQPPLVVFEVETRDNRSMFCNSSKIYGPSTGTIPKPWQHFIIVFKGKLSDYHRESFFNLINQHNVNLFEDIFGKPENRQRLETKLYAFKPDLSQQIKNEMQNSSLGEALRGVLKGLSEGFSDCYLEKPKVLISFKSSNQAQGGTRFSITTETASGKPTFIEKMKEANRTLRSFTIEQPELKKFTLGGKTVIPEKGGKAKIVITPLPKIAPPIRITVPGTNVAFDNILLRRVETNGSIHYLSSEGRNLPFVFNFAVDMEKKRNELNFEFKFSNANVMQALQFEEMIKAISTHKRLRVIEPKENKPLLIFRVRETYQRSEDWCYLLSKLVYIQEKTGHIIRAPDKITDEDVSNIFAIIKIIDTGQICCEVGEISLQTTKRGAKTLIDLFKREGSLCGLNVCQTEIFELLKESIPLGGSTTRLPKMRFVQSLDEVEKIADAADDDAEFFISLKPLDDRKALTTYEKWKTRRLDESVTASFTK